MVVCCGSCLGSGCGSVTGSGVGSTGAAEDSCCVSGGVVYSITGVLELSLALTDEEKGIVDDMLEETLSRVSVLSD